MKDYIERLGYHNSDPDQYLTYSMCNVYKHISSYRFRNRKSRLCIYLHRYRYGHIRNQFGDHIYKFNIQEANSSSFNLSVMLFLGFIDILDLDLFS